MKHLPVILPLCFLLVVIVGSWIGDYRHAKRLKRKIKSHSVSDPEVKIDGNCVSVEWTDSYELEDE